MPKPIEPPRAPRRGTAQEQKSQLGLELALNAYAVLGAAIVLRCLLLSLGVSDRLWIGSAVLSPTDILVRPLAILPGSGFELVGHLTLADATLLAGVVLVPIGIVARPARSRAPI
jgi:hypothetical protein